MSPTGVVRRRPGSGRGSRGSDGECARPARPLSATPGPRAVWHALVRSFPPRRGAAGVRWGGATAGWAPLGSAPRPRPPPAASHRPDVVARCPPRAFPKGRISAARRFLASGRSVRPSVRASCEGRPGVALPALPRPARPGRAPRRLLRTSAAIVCLFIFSLLPSCKRSTPAGPLCLVEQRVGAQGWSF